MDSAALPLTRAEAKRTGSLLYFTGRPCLRGHVAERQTSNGTCRECDRPRQVANVKAWLAKMPDEERRAYRAKAARTCYANNPEPFKEARRRFKERHPHVEPARARAWRMANAEHVRSYQTSYDAKRKDDPVRKEARRFSKRRCHAIERARAVGVPGEFTASDIKRLMDEQGGRCAGFACVADIRTSYEIDHQTPLVCGGTNDPSNLALLCRSCNARKNARTMVEWFVSIGGYAAL